MMEIINWNPNNPTTAKVGLTKREQKLLQRLHDSIHVGQKMPNVKLTQK